MINRRLFLKRLGLSTFILAFKKDISDFKVIDNTKTKEDEKTNTFSYIKESSTGETSYFMDNEHNLISTGVNTYGQL